MSKDKKPETNENLWDSFGAVSKSRLSSMIAALKTELENKIGELQETVNNQKTEISRLNGKLADADTRIASCEKTIDVLKRSMADHDDNKKQIETKMQSTPDSVLQTDEQASVPVPKKRYYSGCSTLGFELPYLLTNPDAISGQGYYEVTDMGNGRGTYQPNVSLAPTLLMNAITMLENIFEIEHDGSGTLKIISIGEVAKQSRVWQITKKCVISY